MRRMLLLASAALLLFIVLPGCAQKQSALETTSSDSLLASNPVEEPPGDITPQSQYSEPAPEPPPAPATKPASMATKPRAQSAPAPHEAPKSKGIQVAAGTPLEISVDTKISTESANVGDTWTGEVKENIIVGDRVVFPAGSVVSGVVTEAVPAKSGTRARLGLAVTGITAHGTMQSVDAPTEPIEAGSPRARNLGAMAGGAAAGALIGNAAGGGKGALIGGLIGGAAAGAAVAKSKGYQVVIKEGTVITFNVKDQVTVAL